jgi:hypothetical protein
METLTFIHKGHRLSKRIIGGVIILSSIMFLIFGKGSMSLKGWLEAGLFFLVGVVYITPLSGSEKTCLTAGEGVLKILWRGSIKEVSIPNTGIEKITLTGNYILIGRKGKKAKSLDITLLEKDQKTKIYEFMIEYAKQNNLVIERY